MTNQYKDSILLDTDSYKASMFLQYPAATTTIYSYISSRGGKYEKTLFMGIAKFAKRLASIRITKAEIDYAERIWTLHGEPFNRAGWDYIANELGGRLPVRIRAVREGTVVPGKNVLATIENTDANCFWLTTWIETSLLRAIWYPTTVGTTSYHIKKIIQAYLEKSGDPSTIGFKLHDFGARGVSSRESAEDGGTAHLVNFMGTDTMSAIVNIMDVYGDDVCAYSIPAAEHSTITSWGRENEVDAYRNMVKQFSKPGSIYAVVSDSYNIYEACKMWGTVLKDDVVNGGGTLVIRPDSGDPLEVLPKMAAILEHYFGVTKVKGYKLLNNVRIIWGDGINATSLESILRTMVDLHGYSADNFAFGMGGGLLQQCDRDTLKFAMKASAALVNGVWVDVFKDPITDAGKASLRGRVTLFKDADGKYYTGREDWMNDQLVTYYEDGLVKFTQSFAEVRSNSEK
jgi:nicotinamide phosphoribosyltransferase